MRVGDGFHRHVRLRSHQVDQSSYYDYPHLESLPTRNAVRVPSAGPDRTLDSNPLGFCSLTLLHCFKRN